MRVLLLYPPKIYGRDIHTGIVSTTPYPPFLPIAIPILTAYLRAHGIEADQDDLDVRVYYDNRFGDDPDLRVDLNPFDDRSRVFAYAAGARDEEIESYTRRIIAKTDIEGYDLVGFSVVNDAAFSGYGTILAMARAIKEQSGTPVAVGGSLGPSHIKDFLETGLVDYGFCVEAGEIPLIQLCRHLRDGSPALEEVPHLRTMKDGRLLWNDLPYRARYSFIRPDFRGLPMHMYRYCARNREGRDVLMLPYLFVQGCVNNCIFCTNSGVKKFHIKPVSEVVSDLEAISEEFDAHSFFFLNSGVNPSYKYIDELCDAILERGLKIRWSDCVNFTHMDRKLLKKLSRAGAMRLIFGLECASERMLRYIGKHVPADKTLEILRMSHENGIWNEIELIAGLPSEHDADIADTIRFIRRTREYVQYYWLNKFMLIEDSRLMREPEKYGITNIRSNLDEALDTKTFKWAFDEIGGLTWEEKVAQINVSYDAINSETQKVNRRNNIHPLFYGFHNSTDKAAAMEMCREICDRDFGTT
ncbi:B12-binding domain-containing radical SAM protein [Thermodesulfobacteriota bacterium]